MLAGNELEKEVGGKYVGEHLLGVGGSKVEFIQDQTLELKIPNT